MEASGPIVFLVDDDPRVRESVSDLLQSVGLQAVALGSVREYLAAQRPDVPACMILDIELPDISGLEFHHQIASGDHPPVVFITGRGDIPSSVRAMKQGAVDFLTKPFRAVDLFAAVNTALERDRHRRKRKEELDLLQHRFAQLTPRERELLPLMVSGLLNKQAAAELGIREVTVQVHRAKIMKKMHAASFADLVRFAEKLNVPITRSRQPGAH